jgi:hypothetical protein
MCVACPQREKCQYVQKWQDCSQCQYAAKDKNGKVTGCACPPSRDCAVSHDKDRCDVVECR